jgi:hypothetical protein
MIGPVLQCDVRPVCLQRPPRISCPASSGRGDNARVTKELEYCINILSAARVM